MRDIRPKQNTLSDNSSAASPSAHSQQSTPSTQGARRSPRRSVAPRITLSLRRGLRRLVRLFRLHYRPILATFLLLASYVLVYKWANSVGYKAGRKAATNAAQESTRNLIDKKSVPYRSLSGTVTEVKESTFSIRTLDGADATFTTNSATKYSQKSVVKSRSDLKVGNQVTVFATDTNSTVATNVVILK